MPRISRGQFKLRERTDAKMPQICGVWMSLVWFETCFSHQAAGTGHALPETSELEQCLVPWVKVETSCQRWQKSSEVLFGSYRIYFSFACLGEFPLAQQTQQGFVAGGSIGSSERVGRQSQLELQNWLKKLVLSL